MKTLFVSLVKAMSGLIKFYHNGKEKKEKRIWHVIVEAKKERRLVANELTDLTNKIIKAVTDDSNQRAALSTVLAIQKARIFEQGLDDSGAKIGTYSTNPISISKKNQARNTGKTYFKGGYDEYKKAIGKNPGFVNLTNTGQEAADYGLVGSNGSYGFGFKNDLNYNKSQWHEEKYKKEIFGLTDNEAKVLENVLLAQLEKIL